MVGFLLTAFMAALSVGRHDRSGRLSGAGGGRERRGEVGVIAIHCAKWRHNKSGEGSLVPI